MDEVRKPRQKRQKPVEPVINESEIKVDALKSEEFQKNGFIVIAMFNENGRKVHVLRKP